MISLNMVYPKKMLQYVNKCKCYHKMCNIKVHVAVSNVNVIIKCISFKEIVTLCYECKVHVNLYLYVPHCLSAYFLSIMISSRSLTTPLI